MFEGKVFIGVVQLRYFKFHYQMPTIFFFKKNLNKRT